MTDAPDSWPGPGEAGLRGGDRTAGRWLASLAAASCLAIFAAGCGSPQPTGATRPPARQGSTAVTTVSPAALRVLARDYLRIAGPANRQLDQANDGYQDTEHASLRAAAADLRAEVITERRFDRQVLRLRFPAWIRLEAADLVRANNRRIGLTTRQARATTLAGLRSLDQQHQAADAAVETRVRQLRNFLGLPPPATS